MLRLTPAGLEVAVARPLGYSDHFGLRRIAEDEARTDRLVAALKASGGSLALSWLNLGEYSTVTDREQHLEVERLIDRILPAVFPLDVAPLDVHKRELAGGPHPPQAELVVALGLVKKVPSLAASGIDFKMTAAGLFERLNDDSIIAAKNRLAGLTRMALEDLRTRHNNNPSARWREEEMTDTLTIMRVMAETFFPDRRRKIDDHTAIDFQHAVVPVAFCDAVLLDGATWDMVGRAQRKLPNVNMGRTFSGRGDGIDRFIDALAVPSSGGTRRG